MLLKVYGESHYGEIHVSQYIVDRINFCIGIEVNKKTTFLLKFWITDASPMTLSGGPPEGNWWQLPHLKSLPKGAKLESKHIPRFYASTVSRAGQRVTPQSSTILFFLVDNFWKNSIVYKKMLKIFRKNRRLFPQFFLDFGTLLLCVLTNDTNAIQRNVKLRKLSNKNLFLFSWEDDSIYCHT